MSIEIKDMGFTYQPGTPWEHTSLKQINLSIASGELVAIIGHTGSGKSTLAQILCGLLAPTTGTCQVEGISIESNTKVSQVVGKVGLVMQYPEQQLFAETVEEDIAFGPKNLGCSEKEVKQRVRRALIRVGLDPDVFAGRSPLMLSGGEKRRVAIAGILAMKPEVLILDEPLAGLDHNGSKVLLELIKNYHNDGQRTIIWISHSMNDVAEVAQRMIVLNKGELVLDGAPEEVFTQKEDLDKWGLDVPAPMQILGELQSRGKDIPGTALTMDGAYEKISAWLGKGAGEDEREVEGEGGDDA